MFNGETEDKIEELVDELYAALVDDRDLRFWEGGIVSVAPTGAPPEFITIEIEGFDDQSVMWRGVPASLSVGDEVVVWENPITHRREILGGSGASTTSTSSPWQKITVAVVGGDFALPSAAITWINALPAPVAPSATRLFSINMLGGTFVEAANVTIPQYVGVEGEGEETVIDMGDFALRLSADSSLENCVVKSTGDDSWLVIRLDQADNAVMRDVRAIVTTEAICVDVYDSDNVELYHVICEAAAANSSYGFAFWKSTGLLWDCKAVDTTNFDIGLYVGSVANPSTATTKFCEFRAASAGDDVSVLANNTWNHFCCNFDPDNSTIAGTEVPLTHGKTNFDDVVTFEDGIMLEEMAAAPGNVANAGWFYTKDDGGDTEAYYEDDGGAEAQLTEDGAIHLAATNILKVQVFS